MKIKIALLAAILILIITVNIDGTYMGVVGNLCERTDKNPAGYCYEELPQKGFPIAWIRDKGTVSPVKTIDMGDLVFSRFILAILVNTLMYFGITYLSLYTLSKIFLNVPYIDDNVI